MAERAPDVARTHKGEQAVQEMAGEGGPLWGSPMFDSEIPSSFAAFLQDQPVVFIGAPDPSGDMWCAVIGDHRGFAQVTGPSDIVLGALPSLDDPLRESFESTTDVGIVAIDFARRRRVRYNGRARRQGDSLHMTTDQVLGNCPKYIRRRSPLLGDDRDATGTGVGQVPGARPAGSVRTADRLAPDNVALIEAAETFFVASRAARLGADASHRGGPPGFVSVPEPGVVVWPDYIGNSFYMTFGNAHLDDRAGLLFVDWTSGDTLQLTGRLSLDWNPGHARAHPGALRLARFEVRRAVRIEQGSAVRWVPLD